MRSYIFKNLTIVFFVILPFINIAILLTNSNEYVFGSKLSFSNNKL